MGEVSSYLVGWKLYFGETQVTLLIIRSLEVLFERNMGEVFVYLVSRGATGKVYG